MKTIKFAFAGPTGALLNNEVSSAYTRNLKITRTATGRYTVTFLTTSDIDETEVAYPIIHVNCQSPTGTGTMTNILNPKATYQSRNKDGYVYLISFQIEVLNALQALPVFTLFNIIALLSGLFLVAFVDRAVVMVSCELTRYYDEDNDTKYSL